MTAATIAGFDTRATVGLAPPDSVSYRIDPSRGGCTAHYFGPKLTIRSHADCRRQWLGAQRHHMDGPYADIAYTGGFCQHGYAIAGRGLGVRTGANGTNPGNDHWYAFAWIGGAGQSPTAEAFAALAWWVRQARVHGGAADRVNGHRDHKSTACPGDPLYRRLPELDRRPIGEPMRTYAQAIVVPTLNFGGKNRDWDRALGHVLGAAYGWAVVETADGDRFVSLTHPGEAATIGDWAGVVGAARYRVDANPPGLRIAGGDREDTAVAVARLMEAHPPKHPDGTWAIDRRGEPW